jgi:hypothetical protein
MTGSLTLPPARSPDGSQPLPKQWVAKLFTKLTARYGTLFTDRYGGLALSEVQEEWAEELAGYTGNELQRGIDGCRGLKFPPTLPEFQMLCRPPLDPQVAFGEAIRNLAKRDQGEDAPWSHPAIFWASMEIGHFELRNSTYPQIKATWERVLSEQMAKRQHEPVPPAMRALPAPKGPPSPVISAHLSELVKKMKMENAGRTFACNIELPPGQAPDN